MTGWYDLALLRDYLRALDRYGHFIRIRVSSVGSCSQMQQVNNYCVGRRAIVLTLEVVVKVIVREFMFMFMLLVLLALT
jgi:hypothetical protein